MKKRSILLAVIILVVFIGLFACSFIFNHDEKVDIKEEKALNYNVSLIEKEKISSYDVKRIMIESVKIENGYFSGLMRSNIDVDLLRFKVIIFDKDGNELESIDFEFVDIKEYDERDLYCFVDKDLSKAYYFDVEIVE